MNEVVAIMTGAAEPGAVGYDQVVKEAGAHGPGARRRGAADRSGGGLESSAIG